MAQRKRYKKITESLLKEVSHPPMHMEVDEEEIDLNKIRIAQELADKFKVTSGDIFCKQVVEALDPPVDGHNVKWALEITLRPLGTTGQITYRGPWHSNWATAVRIARDYIECP